MLEPVKSHENKELRAKIQRDVEAFLANGGEIETESIRKRKIENPDFKDTNQSMFNASKAKRKAPRHGPALTIKPNKS